jgi:carboxylesterase type B
VPLLIGSNADEAPYRPVSAARFRRDVARRYGGETAQLLRFYPAATDAGAGRAQHDLRRDESFASARAEAQDQARLKAPVFLYYFTRQPPGRDRAIHGAFHAAELEYVFNTLDATRRPWEPADRQLAAVMIGYWTNFAKSGDPNGPGLPAWPACGPAGDRYLELGDRVQARVCDAPRLDFLERQLERDAHNPALRLGH